MKIPNDMEVVVKAGARGALPARALASPVQPPIKKFLERRDIRLT